MNAKLLVLPLALLPLGHLAFDPLVFAQRAFAAGPARALQAAAPAAAGAALAGPIEQLAASLARSQRREPPRLDARLSAAAADLARISTDDGPPGGGVILTDALALHGIVEPSPHLLASAYTVGQEQAVLDGLRGPMAEAIGQGRWRRLGVGVAKVSESRSRVVVLLLESFVEVEPMPRAAPVSQAPLWVKGQLLPPYAKPEVLVTNPKGQVERLPGVARGLRFESSFRCALRGRYQIEVLGEDEHGSTVLANFPIYCGEPAPATLAASADAAEPPFRDAREAEEQLLGLLNADRARAGLPALILDPKLSEVARAHSLDMRTNNFLGHVSPRTGNAGDRARRAGIDSVALLENLARAYTPREAERGLMDSPGHRANALDKNVTHVGIGVEIGPAQGGVRELFVTELLQRPPAPFDPQKAPVEALARLQELRKKEGAPALRPDADLGSVAARTAADVAAGKLSPERVGEPVQALLGRLGARFSSLRTVLALTSDVGRMTASPALLDPKATHAGVGVAPAPRDEKRGPGVYVVVVLGQGVPAREK